MANSITRLFDKITGRKKKNERKVARSRFNHYKSTARMLAIALEQGMQFVPDFLELTDYIHSLTLPFTDTPCFYKSFVLPDLRSLGFENQAEALETVINNSYLPMSKNESQMKEYIQLLWNLFFTPDPE